MDPSPPPPSHPSPKSIITVHCVYVVFLGLRSSKGPYQESSFGSYSLVKEISVGTIFTIINIMTLIILLMRIGVDNYIKN
jgi:hypothetical protein